MTNGMLRDTPRAPPSKELSSLFLSPSSNYPFSTSFPTQSVSPLRCMYSSTAFPSPALPSRQKDLPYAKKQNNELTAVWCCPPDGLERAA